jgi:hypothetical protein
MRGWLPPALALFLLAPALGELLSGSAPPAEFFTIFGFLTIAVLYGGGALLCREAMVRWNKGWLTLLMLGVAYAFLEEGLMCKSFFDPHWQDLGDMEYYGRWGGVNVPWTIALTGYHAFFSVGVSVLLVELFYPSARRRPWLRPWSLVLVSILLLLDVVLIAGFLPYWPAVSSYLLLVAATALVVVAARYLPARLPRRWEGVWAAPPWMLFLLTLLASGVWIMLGWALASLGVPSGVAVVLLLIVGAALLVSGVLLCGYGWALDDRHRLALVAGSLTFWILNTPLQEFSVPREDDPAGMTLVGMAFALLLVWLAYSVKRRLASSSERREHAPPSAPPAAHLVE